MKYIIFKDPTGSEHPVLFPEEMGHIDIKNLIVKHPQYSLEPVSAGFVRMEHNQLQTSGRSTGLSLSCRSEDINIITSSLL